ncbi:Aspartyl protease [Scheffersomyces spartinae]|uniref:candidapepsin n=1 Tax=Scheffersomyces spartinae TaxID=45513 RepID=A0A9P8AGG3_9ASCO|nr:Aspartyl protease [Scheffersomyces spartinae]KAG7191709.1 Aspartyl protease [Scheffersomyces spartinae]
MLVGHLLSAAGLLLASGVLANQVPQIDFLVRRGNSYSESKFGANFEIKEVFNAKRNEIELILTNQGTFYLAEVTVGSNNQSMDVLIDTGSSDFWLLSSNVVCVDRNWLLTVSPSIITQSPLSKKRDLNRRQHPTPIKRPIKAVISDVGPASAAQTDIQTLSTYSTTNTCTLYGTFNTGTSDTFKANSSSYDFYTSFLDGTEVAGVWAVDNVLIGGISLENVTFGVGEVATSYPGLLGIGMEGLESTNSGPNPYTYVNFPAKLVEEGLIKRNAFSLYLTESGGTVLFGAVDTAKFQGSLFSLPLVNTLENLGYTKPIEFSVALSGMSYNNITIFNSNFAATLDSGTTLSYFPVSIMNNLASTLGAVYVPSVQLYALSCPTTSQNLTFDFNGGEINIPLNNLISRIYGQCFLNILPKQEGDANFLLGDNFLRHAYVVYDADALEIAMAPIKDTTESNILVLSEFVSATPVAGYSNTKVATTDSSQSFQSTATKLLVSQTSSKKNDGGIINASSTSLMFVFLLSIFTFIM